MFYFGGKSQVASLVWAAIGQPRHYIEPFFGSGAVLLLRPDYDPAKMTESLCDKDGYVANVWRALQAAPDEVAKWCDWPVNHADLAARRDRLIQNESRLLENLIADDEWYDAKLAGYWIWAASCWIGSGLTRPNQRPHISQAGKGINAIGKRPHISQAGKGINAIGQIPHISQAGMGVQELYSPHLYVWFRALSERLRHVRVVCGDWQRVCGGNWQNELGTCGIFFDPPYGILDRDTAIYQHDSTTVAAEVQAWALARGVNTDYRIVLAGYYREHENLLKHGWTVHLWKSQGGYANSARAAEKTQGQKNRFREALFFSPHCLRPSGAAVVPQQGGLEF